MKIINLTPHDVVVDTPEFTTTYKATGIVCRIKTEEVVIATLNDIPLTTVEYSGVHFTDDVPEADYYIVSGIVLDAVRGTEWEQKFIAPNTSTANRDMNNRIVSVKNFRTNAKKVLTYGQQVDTM